jgi:ferritin-like metal-binding protein YciE
MELANLVVTSLSATLAGRLSTYYEISRYGTLMVWAQVLGMTEAAAILNRMFQEEIRAHALLIKLAEKAINREAQPA